VKTRLSLRASGAHAERRLRRALLLFFLALAVPAALLAWRAYGQVQWQVFHQYRTLADELAGRVDAALARAIAREDARSFDDYGFLVVDAAVRGGLALSPLARLSDEARLPGLVGYFQVDSAGRYSSPHLPPTGTQAREWGIDETELARRQALAERVRSLLGAPAARPARRAEVAAAETAPPASAREDVVAAVPADGAEGTGGAPRPRATRGNAFERLVDPRQARQAASGPYGKLADLELDSRLERKSRAVTPPAAVANAQRGSRKEQVAMLAPEPRPADDAVGVAETAPDQAGFAGRARAASEMMPPAPAAPAADGPRAPRVSLFESELDPPSFQVLDEAHFVVFRNVWRAGERYVQGAVVARAPFLAEAIVEPFRASLLATMSDLVVAWQGEVLALERAVPGGGRRYERLDGELLYRTRLSAPLSELELVFSVSELPLGASGVWLAWITLAFVLVLSGGCLAIYHFARGHLRLLRQQQDFVAAVSHELKTPLTSIRMYSEMLEAGWADENKKAGWYRYIRVEAERLSRLIANVLTLARMTRGQDTLELRTQPLGALLERIGATLGAPLTAADFTLERDIDPAAAVARVAVDEDALTQVLLNLVENAIKFTPADAPRRIELAAHPAGADAVAVSVRDHGRGVPRAAQRQIFDLFYRAGDELTRETTGTGIGLALVRELVSAMHGRVEVADAAPGARFTISLPRARSADD